MLVIIFFLASWEILTVPTSEDLLGVFFIDDQWGWAVGKNDEIIYTTDGGDTWGLQNSTTNNYDLYDIIFIDRYYGWACGWNPYSGFGIIIGTANSGSSWGQQPASTSYTEGIDFYDQNYGWAVGMDIYSSNNAQVLRTTSGGSTWFDYTLVYVSYLKGVDFYSSDTGFACGTNGVLIKSTNGGIAWTAIPTGITKTLYDVQAFDDNHIIIAGDTFLITTDGGSSWIYRAIGRLKSLSFLDLNRGWVCGDSGIFHTEDSGNIWVEETTAATARLNSIHMIDSVHGFCAGDNGVMLRRIVPPSVSEEKIKIITGRTPQSGVYDITGRRVSKILSKGIYFIVDRKETRKVVKIE